MASTQYGTAVSGAEIAARLNLKKYSLTVPTIQDARARSISGAAVANLVGQPGRDWMSDVKRQHWSQIEEMVALFYENFPPGDLGKDTLNDIFMRFESPKKIAHVLKSTLPEVLKVVFESASRQMWLVVEELSAQYGPLKAGNDKEMAVAKAQHFLKMSSLLQSPAFQGRSDKFLSTVRSDLTTHVSFIDFCNAYRCVFAAPTMPPAPDAAWSPQDWNQRSEPTTPTASSALGPTSPATPSPQLTTPDEINRAKFDHYRRAALQGNPQAQYLLAMMYGGHDGHGYSSERQGSLVRNDSAATGLLLSPNSAFTRTGSLSARTPAGARASSKLPPSEPLAFQMKFQWLVMSAEAGYSPAQYELATLFRDDVVPEELLQKEQLRVQAAEEKLRQEQGRDATAVKQSSANDSTLSLDNEELAFKDALLVNRQPNADPLKTFARGQMFRWWDSAAKQGEKRSAFQLGLLFLYGVCPTPDEIQARAHSASDEVIRWIPPDFRKALEWFEKAVGRDETTLHHLQRLANQGDAVAQYQLGVHKLLGTAFTPSNKPEAYELFKKAAAQGNVDAKYNLGLLSYIGIYNLLPENPSGAKKLWKEAADQGHTLAATALANATKYESFDDVVTSTSAIEMSDANLVSSPTPLGPPKGEKTAPAPVVPGANKAPPPLGRTNSLEKRIADSMNQKPRENCRGCQQGNCTVS